MSKKLEANGIWESSRMIIPQHKEAAIRQMTEIKRFPRPTLDEQEIALISEALMKSAAYLKSITLTMYSEYEPRIITGVVSSFDRTQCRLDTVDQVDGSRDWEWIQFTDVLKAEISGEWTEEDMQGPQ
jgi:hypothetical protein